MPDKADARAGIDRLLSAAGWAVQDYKYCNPGAGQGIALRQVPLKGGPCDYLLLVDRVATGVIKAKREGTRLFSVADQSEFYAGNLSTFLQAEDIVGICRAVS